MEVCVEFHQSMMQWAAIIIESAIKGTGLDLCLRSMSRIFCGDNFRTSLRADTPHISSSLEGKRGGPSDNAELDVDLSFQTCIFGSNSKPFTLTFTRKCQLSNYSSNAFRYGIKIFDWLHEAFTFSTIHMLFKICICCLCMTLLTLFLAEPIDICTMLPVVHHHSNLLYH